MSKLTVDLSDELPGDDQPLAPTTVQVAEEVDVPRRHVIHRERTRTWLAAVILSTVPATIVLTFALAFVVMFSAAGRFTIGEIEAFGIAMLTPLVGIAGAVIGFYYSQRHPDGL